MCQQRQRPIVRVNPIAAKTRVTEPAQHRSSGFAEQHTACSDDAVRHAAVVNRADCRGEWSKDCHRLPRAQRGSTSEQVPEAAELQALQHQCRPAVVARRQVAQRNSVGVVGERQGAHLGVDGLRRSGRVEHLDRGRARRLGSRVAEEHVGAGTGAEFADEAESGDQV